MANFGKALRELTNMRNSLQAQMDEVQSELAKVDAAIEHLNALDAPARPTRRKAKAAGGKAAKAPQAAKAPAAKAAAAKPAAEAAPAAKKRQVGGKRGYPKFARAGKKLVEVKWNSKKNGEQRHRMDFATVNLFVKAINKQGDQLFRKNLLTEVTNKEGNRLPLHQVYSVLGWLLSSKAIAKKGRGDYKPDATKLSATALKEAFNTLPDEGTTRVVAKQK